MGQKRRITKKYCQSKKNAYLSQVLGQNLHKEHMNFQKVLKLLELITKHLPTIIIVVEEFKNVFEEETKKDGTLQKK